MLMAPKLSLNIFENVRIVTNAGTAHGNKKIVLKNRCPFIHGWFATIATKTPKPTDNVVAKNVQMSVHCKTSKNAALKDDFTNSLTKFSNPTQSIKLAGGVCAKS